jgi:uncharacterized membrane protein
MGPIHLHNPVSPTFIVVVAGAVLLLVLLIKLGILRYAFMRLGVSSRAALFLLFGSILGSSINIPLVEVGGGLTALPDSNPFFPQPTLLWGGTVIAVNVGGAVIPIAMSLYLLITKRLWGVGLVATACVATICYWLAQPVAGEGIELSIVVPAIATAAAALVLGGRHAAALAYISGSLGTLIGADLLNLGQVGALGAPMASIGGAGTYDGIFLIGVLAVLIASFSSRRDRAEADPGSIERHSH